MQNNINFQNTTKLLNIKQTQSHPFHVLHSSKLPIFIATLSGCLALVFIAKLHDINFNDMHAYSFVAAQLLTPLFSVNTFDHFSFNITILCFIIFLSIGMWC
jgi:hypothetical protein